MGTTSGRIIKNTIYLYIKIGVTTVISLYTTRLVLEALGVSDFGIYNMVGGVIAMLGFLNSAMATATQRFMSFSEGENNKEKQTVIFNISFVIHLLIAVLMVIILIGVGIYLFNSVLNIPDNRVTAAKVVYGCLIISTAFGVMSVPYDAMLNTHENMLYYSLVGIIESVLKLAVAISLFYTTQDKLIVYGLLMALIPIFTLSIMRIYCHRKYNECRLSPIKLFNIKLAKDMTSFASWSFLPNAANIIVIQGSSIILNIFGGVTVNAAHGIANQLAGYLLIFSNNMLKALNPVIVKKEGGHERGQMLRFSLSGNKFSFLLFAFFAIPFLIESDYILKLWLKNPPEYASLFCKLIIIRRLIGQLTVTFPTSIGATGKIKWQSLSKFIIMILTLPLSWFLYKSGFPIYTIYIVFIFMVTATDLSDLIFMNKLCDLKIKDFINKVVLPCVLISAIVYIISNGVSTLQSDGILRLLCVLLCSSILFCILFITIGLDKSERTLLNNIKKKFRHQ